MQEPRQLSRRVRTYLSVIDLTGAEQGAHRVVCGDEEASDVDEEGSSDVEEDKEEVQADKAEEGVDLGHRGLLLQVVEGGVFRQLYTRASARDLSHKECMGATTLTRRGGRCQLQAPGSRLQCTRRRIVIWWCVSTYLFVELRQVGLGLFLDRHYGSMKLVAREQVRECEMEAEEG